MLSLLAEISNTILKPVHKWNFKRIKRPVKDLLIVAGIYLGFSLLLTWPLVLHLAEAVPGPPYQDQQQKLWTFWWARFSILTLHTNPFHTDYLFYPYGADLYLHTLDLTNGLLSLPFQIFNLIFAYNVVIFVGLVLTGLATYLLGMEIGLSRIGASMAGALMVFSPVHFHFLNGEIEFVNFGWFIFYLLWLVRLEKATQAIDWRYITSGGLLITLVGYMSSYQVVWIGVISLFWLIKEFWFRREGLKRWVVNWLAGWAFGVILLSPLIIGIILQLRSGKVFAEESLDYLVKSGVSLSNFLFPSYHNPFINFLTHNYDWKLESTDEFFIGFTFLVLAGLGLYYYLQRKEPVRLAFWLITGVIFGILSLGPELHIGREGTGIPLPYRVLLELPLGKIVRNSARFIEVFLVGLALVAGFGFQKLLSRPWPFKLGKPALAAFTGLLILLEFWNFPYPITEISIPAAYKYIKAPGAVLELPLNEHDVSDALAMAYQTFHERPILPAYLSRRIDTPYEQSNSPLALLIYRSNKPEICSVPPAENALNVLRVWGVSTIVFHRDREPSAEQEEAYLIQVTKKQPYYRNNEISLFEVEPGPARPAFVIGSGWYATEKISENEAARWFNQSADFDTYTAQAGEATLEFKAVAFDRPQHIKILVNNQEVGIVAVSPELAPYQLKIKLKQGQNRVDLIAQEPPLSPRDLGQGSDARKLSVQIRQVSLT